MERNTILDYQKFIFATLFITANKLQVIGDQFLEEVTTKQWLLLVMIGQFNDHPPTLGQLSALMGTSHQNTKQIALKLETKGFLLIEKDSKDSRILRFKHTQKALDFFTKRNDGDLVFLTELFQGFSEGELNSFAKGLYKMTQNLSVMDKTTKSEEFGWIRDLFN